MVHSCSQLGQMETVKQDKDGQMETVKQERDGRSCTGYLGQRFKSPYLRKVGLALQWVEYECLRLDFAGAPRLGTLLGRSPLHRLLLLGCFGW